MVIRHSLYVDICKNNRDTLCRENKIKHLGLQGKLLMKIAAQMNHLSRIYISLPVTT